MVITSSNDKKVGTLFLKEMRKTRNRRHNRKTLEKVYVLHTAENNDNDNNKIQKNENYFVFTYFIVNVHDAYCKMICAVCWRMKNTIYSIKRTTFVHSDVVKNRQTLRSCRK